MPNESQLVGIHGSGYISALMICRYGNFMGLRQALAAILTWVIHGRATFEIHILVHVVDTAVKRRVLVNLVYLSGSGINIIGSDPQFESLADREVFLDFDSSCVVTRSYHLVIGICDKRSDRASIVEGEFDISQRAVYRAVRYYTIPVHNSRRQLDYKRGDIRDHAFVIRDRLGIVGRVRSARGYIGLP